ncbi:MAG: FGGY family carbohydrate kinase, partial [Planctomycetota bacterium]
MSVLVGIELCGTEVVLTVVSRGAEILATVTEPLSEPMAAWWRCHPEERYRAVLSTLERAVGEGALRSDQVAGIGLSGETGLVLLDLEFKAIPPRSIPWEELFGEECSRSPVPALRVLAEKKPRLANRIGLVMSPIDYIRFRLTGALATHVGFAWSTGLVEGPEAADSWNPEACMSLGLSPRAFPPIFHATCRVGVVQEEVSKRTGLRTGL